MRFLPFQGPLFEEELSVSWRGQTNGVLCLFVTMHRFRDSYGQKGVWKGEGESDLIVLPTRMGNRCDVG